MSILSNCINIMGKDDMGILLLAFNPILGHLVYKEPWRSMLLVESVGQYGTQFHATLLCYVANIVTSAFYGLLLDAFRVHVKRTTVKKLDQ